MTASESRRENEGECMSEWVSGSESRRVTWERLSKASL